jgi:glycyl-tRNA synthetase beta chain
MTASKSLLVELFVEELPPKALRTLGTAFGEAIANGLIRFQLKDRTFGRPSRRPRRLAVLVPEVAAQANDRTESVKLMPANVAFTANGEPTPALVKRIAALGADSSAITQLQRRVEGKGEVLYLDRVVKGARLAEALQAILDDTLAKLPIPKVMQYQLADGWTSVKFVRPAHRLVALHGADVVPIEALGLKAGRTTQGHRFESATPTIELRDADGYAEQLRAEGALIASFDERRADIVRQLAAAATADGLAPIDDDALLDEVTALVERPNVLLCRFEPEFLAVPPECLILTMKANQKYFPLLDASGNLTNRFLVVSNIRPADPRRVVEGNERVVRPRLADARFFYDQDRKKTLASRAAGLDKVVYHGKLGTQGERVGRIRAIARWVAERIGADVGQADRAAELAKADLLTDMVGEFPELQGVMGGYYARHDGEPEDVAGAIASQYLNRRKDDAQSATVNPGRRGAADRRPGRDAGRHLGHRPEADRREGPVRAAPPCADLDRRVRPRHGRQRRGGEAPVAARPAGGRALDVHIGHAPARYRRSGRGLRLRALREPARRRLRRADRRRGDRPAPAAAAGRAPRRGGARVPAPR